MLCRKEEYVIEEGCMLEFMYHNKDRAIKSKGNKEKCALIGKNNN